MHERINCNVKSMNKYAKIHQNNPNSSNVMSKAKWIYNFFSSCVAHVKKSPTRFFAQTDERICHLSSLPTRNKYWAIFRLSICKAKILNGCKSCSGVIVGHLPPMFSPIIFIHAIHALIRLTFRCNFSISKESVFSRGNFNFFEAAQLAGQLNRLSPLLPFCVFLPD